MIFSLVCIHDKYNIIRHIFLRRYDARVLVDSFLVQYFQLCTFFRVAWNKKEKKMNRKKNCTKKILLIFSRDNEENWSIGWISKNGFCSEIITGKIRFMWRKNHQPYCHLVRIMFWNTNCWIWILHKSEKKPERGECEEAKK